MQQRTQVAIIGGGPAGLLLSHMLHLGGIESVVLERQTKAYVLKRIRAGVLEYGTVKLLRDAGLGERLDREGHVHDGCFIVWQDREPLLVSTKEHAGKPMWSHGQTAITEELYRVRERDGGSIVEEADERPASRYRRRRAESHLRLEWRVADARHATSSQAATGFMACRAGAFQRASCEPSSALIRSAGLVSCRKRRLWER